MVEAKACRGAFLKKCNLSLLCGSIFDKKVLVHSLINIRK